MGLAPTGVTMTTSATGVLELMAELLVLVVQREWLERNRSSQTRHQNNKAKRRTERVKNKEADVMAEARQC